MEFSELRKEFAKGVDRERHNELEIQVRIELIHLAKRVNQGGKYEIRAGLPSRPEELDEEKRQNQQLVREYEKALKQYEELSVIANRVNESGAHVTEALSSSADQPMLVDYDKLELSPPEKLRK